jgi:predicted metal-dependent hydrolase
MKVQYGKKEITFSHRVNPKLKHAYITVDFNEGVILKSPPLEEERAREMVRKKAPWIMEKLKLVAREPQGDIATGTRILYLGRKYYTKVIKDKSTAGAVVTFNYSTFNVYVNPSLPHPQETISSAFEGFYRRKAVEKIVPRVRQWTRETGLQPTGLRFRKLSKRWGSCTKTNEIIINIDTVKLPFSLIDYIVVHELCHLEHKGHTKAFWREVEKYIPAYRELESRLSGMRC